MSFRRGGGEGDSFPEIFLVATQSIVKLQNEIRSFIRTCGITI